jgi:hypothetical protein
MNIVALDLGTHTGYAYNLGPDFTVGTWHLASGKEITKWGKDRYTRRKDPRVERLCEKLEALPVFDVLVFEDVQFVSSQKQAHLWASFRTVAQLCGKAAIFECVDVKTLKKFATGSGNADKEAMRRALYAHHPKMLGHLDDNGVDAAWLWHWANQKLSRTPKIPHHD